jgi:hypothetical protein
VTIKFLSDTHTVAVTVENIVSHFPENKTETAASPSWAEVNLLVARSFDSQCTLATVANAATHRRGKAIAS